jgi:hypothetical protein
MKQKCLKCGIEFDDALYKKEYKSAERFYCDSCVDILWKDSKEKK